MTARPFDRKHLVEAASAGLTRGPPDLSWGEGPRPGVGRSGRHHEAQWWWRCHVGGDH